MQWGWGGGFLALCGGMGHEIGPAGLGFVVFFAVLFFLFYFVFWYFLFNYFLLYLLVVY
jgi:hypothetical protein